ncbi:MAG: YSIRK-type signal peptide-containing protein [Candidatus Marinimicrobia bacterium]|nr:YSIRK-type signal peptide-containing protein [Candidatus Neomarinimicrobiota bacterium]
MLRTSRQGIELLIPKQRRYSLRKLKRGVCS